ncbi:diaminopropionate ammonia-lyase [Brachybacterium paraconglomeratum]|uniref:diaminopropionate ammonia-lyase n=1 Tax=Brachybacterium paraconglomeratum TaxID=173362 RepID=UPI00223B6215|nr:diaminopropionate ammonia-lyase [Brachybacterium paraconglomeratum]MCT1436366.1 diaminopropionate ammonia-lyase [Brachybacterium paraconglomeratum]
MTDPRTALLARPSARGWRTAPAPELLDFHRSIPGYAPTRLVDLPSLARELGVARVWLKEESSRYGLPAFKMLGATHAVARALSARVGVTDRPLPFDELTERIEQSGVLELVAATDGNHGRAVAHCAALVGLPARVFVPQGVSEQAIEGIRSEGAEVTVLDRPYDDVVVHAAEQAAADGSLLVQDTSWDGYEQIPAWIVEGYASVLSEAVAQLHDAGADAPSLVTAPTGVGAFAEAVVRFVRSGGFARGLGSSDSPAPQVLTVEPEAAPCLLTSLRADRSVTVETGGTIMAGLNCGTVAASSWPVLRAGVDLSAMVSDDATAQAVRDLAALGVDSGPCGASSLAAVRLLAAQGQLPAEGNLLLISTEGRAANPLPADF